VARNQGVGCLPIRSLWLGDLVKQSHILTSIAGQISRAYSMWNSQSAPGIHRGFQMLPCVVQLSLGSYLPYLAEWGYCGGRVGWISTAILFSFYWVEREEFLLDWRKCK
jgi:hypothetical protein